MTEGVNAIFYRADNGIKWRNLPSDSPVWQTVYGYFNLWAKLGVWEQVNLTLSQQVRRQADPSLAIAPSRNVRYAISNQRLWRVNFDD